VLGCLECSCVGLFGDQTDVHVHLGRSVLVQGHLVIILEIQCMLC